MRVLILNGPNLNLLGQREPDLYGTKTYDDLCQHLQATAQHLNLVIDIRQTNHEGVLVDWIQGAKGQGFDALVINPAAYTHTSIALLDAILAVGLPTIEVHLTDPDEREPFRRVSYLRPACAATFKGQGFASYDQALNTLAHG